MEGRAQEAEPPKKPRSGSAMHAAFNVAEGEEGEEEQGEEDEEAAEAAENVEVVEEEEAEKEEGDSFFTRPMMVSVRKAGQDGTRRANCFKVMYENFEEEWLPRAEVPRQLINRFWSSSISQSSDSEEEDDDDDDDDDEEPDAPLPENNGGKPVRAEGALAKANYNLATQEGAVVLLDACNNASLQGLELFTPTRSGEHGNSAKWGLVATIVSKSNSMKVDSDHLRTTIWRGRVAVVGKKKAVVSLMQLLRPRFSQTHARGESGSTEDAHKEFGVEIIDDEHEKTLVALAQTVFNLLSFEALAKAAIDKAEKAAGEKAAAREAAEAEVDAALGGAAGRRGRNKSSNSGGRGGSAADPTATPPPRRASQDSDGSGGVASGAASGAASTGRARRSGQGWGFSEKGDKKPTFKRHPHLTELGMTLPVQKAWCVLDETEDDFYAENPPPQIKAAEAESMGLHEDESVGYKIDWSVGDGEWVPHDRHHHNYLDGFLQHEKVARQFPGALAAYKTYSSWYNAATPEQQAKAEAAVYKLQSAKANVSPVKGDLAQLTGIIEQMGAEGNKMVQMSIDDKAQARKDEATEAEARRSHDAAEAAARRSHDAAEAAAQRTHAAGLESQKLAIQVEADKRQHAMMMVMIGARSGGGGGGGGEAAASSAAAGGSGGGGGGGGASSGAGGAAAAQSQWQTIDAMLAALFPSNLQRQGECARILDTKRTCSMCCASPTARGSSPRTSRRPASRRRTLARLSGRSIASERDSNSL